MAWHWLIGDWVRRLAEQRIREAVVEAAHEHLATAAQSSCGQPWAVGVVFALGEESGGLEDLLDGVVTIRGEGFVVRQGHWKGRRVGITLSGPGPQAAATACEAMIAGHRPAWVISAGFCGGLDPAIHRGDILVANRLAGVDGQEIVVDLSPLASGSLLDRRAVHVGRLVTVGRTVRTPREKRSLGQAYQALGVDLESLAVAEVCRARAVRFLAVRAVSDAVDDLLPKEVDRLAKQRSRARRLGAAIGTLLDRPGALADMLRLRQNALQASDRLAKFLLRVVEHLVPAEQPAS